MGRGHIKGPCQPLVDLVQEARPGVCAVREWGGLPSVGWRCWAWGEPGPWGLSGWEGMQSVG